jgi:hypothetical protein
MEDEKTRAAASGPADASDPSQHGSGMPLHRREEIRELGEHERHMLECLGAAVVSVWNDLPRSTQRAIFESAAAQQAYDTVMLRRQIACFLHDHNG